VINCPDSTDVAALPAGFPAYLGYVDGDDRTAAALAGQFPHADLILLTVTGDTFECNGADIEPGNLTAADGARWAAGYLNGRHGLAPVLYASTIGEPGYGMLEVIRQLAARSIAPGDVRLLSAHYGAGPHICGPDSCRLIDIDMDGTQWTDTAQGNRGAVIDMSMLAAGFFGAPEDNTEDLVQSLGIVHSGTSGAQVKTVQALCNARGIAAPIKIDGIFGVDTRAAVQITQQHFSVAADGIVGPATWPVLLGLA
jgi:hypothetical protein